MIFAYPLGLIGLLSLPAILALHLLQQRNRKVVVSSLFLWGFLEKQVHGARFRRIPFNLLLVLDLLIAALISTALAQPRLRLSLPFGTGVHQIFIIDTSTSMMARDASPSRFEVARQSILAQFDSSRFGDRLTVIEAGKQARLVGDTYLNTVEEILEAIQSLQAGSAGTALWEAVAFAEALRDPTLPYQIHIFSDGAWGITPLDDLNTSNVFWNWMGEAQPNQAVIDVSVIKNLASEWEVQALLANFDRQPVRRLIALQTQDQLIDSYEVQLPPRQVFPLFWKFETNSLSTVMVSLTGNDLLPQDDRAVTALTSANLSTALRVAVVANQPKEILKALNSFPEVEAQTFVVPDDLPPRGFDLVIYHQISPRVYTHPSILLLDPPSVDWLEIENQVPLNAWVASQASPLVENLDSSGLRGVKVSKISQSPEGFQTLLQTTDNPPKPIYIQGQHMGSQVWVFLAQISSGNFTRHPVFVALLGNLIRQIARPNFPANLKVGDPIPLPSFDQYPLLKIQPPKGEAISFGSNRPLEWSATHQPGIYRFELVDREGVGQTIAVGVNAGDWQESNLLDLQRNLPSNEKQPERQLLETQYFELTPWLLVLAVVLFLVEARYAWR